jgi:hypothetical protein
MSDFWKPKVVVLLDEHGKATYHQSEPYEPYKYVVEAKIRLPDTPPAISRQENPKPRWHEFTEGKKWALEIFAFVALCVCGVIYFFQMLANRDQAQAAKDQLVVMSRTLDDSEAQLCSKLEITSVTLARMTNQYVAPGDYGGEVRVVVENSGGTEASNLKIWYSFYDGPTGVQLAGNGEPPYYGGPRTPRPWGGANIKAQGIYQWNPPAPACTNENGRDILIQLWADSTDIFGHAHGNGSFWRYSYSNSNCAITFEYPDQQPNRTNSLKN